MSPAVRVGRQICGGGGEHRRNESGTRVAAAAMGLGIPATCSPPPWRRWLIGLAAPDERVATALGRLERVVQDYRAWAPAAAR
jgi:hypothetical protein